MSGLEVASLVLGAFPIAIMALEKYREVCTRIDHFRKIKPRYVECKQNLRFYQASFKNYIRQLLLPIIEDENRINDLLSNPDDSSWKDKDISELLRHQLGKDCHELVLDCIRYIKDTMEELNHELALSSIPEPLDSEPRSNRPAANLKFFLYRLKFSNGEHVRAALFDKLKGYDIQLGRLLNIRDNDANTRQTASSKILSNGDLALCSFWKYVNTFSKALASAWTSCCQGEHIARLLLQHRTSKDLEFNVLFTKQLASHWQIRKTLITDGDTSPFNKDIATAECSNVTATTVHEPKRREIIPFKSAMKRGGKPNPKPLPARIATSSTTCVDRIEPILNLCNSLDQSCNSCYGYLTSEDFRYYVHSVPQHETKEFNYITLEQIILKQVSPAASRRKRYVLSFTLASAFLQLLDTPWIPELWSRSDIIFIDSDKEPNTFLLDQPYLTRKFITRPLLENEQRLASQSTATKSVSLRTFRPLELLGIVLIELCFGRSLEEQSSQGQLPTQNNDINKYMLDIMVARTWVDEVNEEAGPEFDEAIRWCLGGYLNKPPDEWRREMLRRVVRPLGKCLEYLNE